MAGRYYFVDQLTQLEMLNRFLPDKLEKERTERTMEVREQFRQTAVFVHQRCPRGRELSLAITKLEEAMFWASAAIARSEPPPKLPPDPPPQPSAC